MKEFASTINPLYEFVVWVFLKTQYYATPNNAKDLLINWPKYYDLWWRSLLREVPQHIFIETCLIMFIIWLLFIRRTVDPKKSAKNEKLSDKEINWLVETWQPEPLVPSLTDKQLAISGGMMIVESMNGNYLNVKGIKAKILNLSSLDFLGMGSNLNVKKSSLDALDVYGCGSCGPRGFYGTIDQHLKIEDAVAKFMGTEQAIAYSDGASAVSSAIPAFCKRGDLLVVDEACGEPVLTGCNLSRSTIHYFSHNNPNDLEELLMKIAEDDKRLRRNPADQRRFIIVEGLYRNTGEICNLPKILEIKQRFCYRLIVDESTSFGAIGATGRGITEHFGIPMTSIEICMIAMDTVLASVGGICIGSREIVDHQRLSGAGYCFSASSPPFLSAAATTALQIIEQTPQLLTNLRLNTTYFLSGLKKIKRLVALSSPESPIIHLAVQPPMATREEEEEYTMRLARMCIEKGVGLSSSKFTLVRSPDCLRPTLRICCSSTLSKAQIDDALRGIAEAVASIA